MTEYLFIKESILCFGCTTYVRRYLSLLNIQLVQSYYFLSELQAGNKKCSKTCTGGIRMVDVDAGPNMLLPL